MYKFRKYNSANRFEFSVENFATKMFGTGAYVKQAILNCKVDYATREILFSIHDLEGGTTERFFDHLDEDPKLTVRLRMYRRQSGDAGPLVDYTKRFHGAKIESRSFSLGYDVVEAAIHHVVMSFESSELEFYEEADDQDRKPIC
ncbi:MAG: hypothetical protein EOO77_45560 [Oxalobacteraceae bacterium]|nr:MAG: hypothetical protein EOO77_45560 [Oxalobacteraceae bacterium]